jgi:PAS domain S-box-containing protein
MWTMVEDKRILIVEDEVIVAADLQQRLQGMGYAVPATVPSGEMAIKKIGEIHPDLVLMDIHLNGRMDGTEAAARIMREWDIPVVYLTAYADRETMQRAGVTGPYGYLLKPYEGRELAAAIEVAFEKHKLDRRVRESERWLASTLQSIGDAVIATNPDGDVRLINPVAERLTGWRRDEVLGRPISDLFVLMEEAHRPSSVKMLTRALQQGTSTGSAGRTLVAREGLRTPIDLTCNPIHDEWERPRGVIIVFRDATDRKRAEEETRRRMAYLKTMNTILSAASVAANLPELLAIALDQVLQLFDVPAGAIWLGPATSLPGVEKAVEVVRCLSHGFGQKALQALSGDVAEVILPAEGRSEAGRTARALLEWAGLRSAMVSPVTTGTESCGVLCIAADDERCWSTDDTATLSAVARQLGVAAERLVLFHQTVRHAEALQAALTRLRELDRLKSQFVQTVSHELRTPLALILGYAEVLADGTLGELPAQQQEVIEVIARRSRMLSGMVEDITLLLESEQALSDRQAVALEDVLNASVADLAGVISAGGLVLEMDIAPNLPPVVGTRNHLARIVGNLLNNAAKFTPAGGAVTLRAAPQNGHVVVQVADTGIGIPPEEQARVFERFYQIDGAANRRYGGMGLGLALVKEIVEALGGKVSLESEVGCGSTFTVLLPVADGDLLAVPDGLC